MAALICKRVLNMLRQSSLPWALILSVLSACTLQVGFESSPDSDTAGQIVTAASPPSLIESSPVADAPTPTQIPPTVTPSPGATESEVPATSTPTSQPSAPTATTPAQPHCEEAWFFAVPAHFADHCPQPVVVSDAAAQRFQYGMMIWLAQPGRYHVLTNQTLYEGELRKAAYQIDDPLDVTADSIADFPPSAGLIAPMSGFGLLWRGDVSQSPGFHESLGWATAPEFPYQASYQCEIGSVSGGRTWRFCFLLNPDGYIIVLHALDGWLWLSEWES